MENAPALATAQPAQSLAVAGRYLEQQPLSYDDPLYVDLRAGRATKELTELELFLRNAAGTPNAFAKAAFIGNRGGGKSTFLLHLEHDLQRAGHFTPLHVYLDPSLESDCDYSDLLLWMVDEVARTFAERGYPVDDVELSRVTVWFAEKTIEKTTDWKKEIGLETSAEASAGHGIPGIFSLKLLARLKSMIVGSEQSRTQIRQSIQPYAYELRDRVNGFFDHARAVLRAAGQPDRLLIVQDNLDRLKRDVARQLFENGGELLVAIRADLIYTAPLALNLAPYDISRIFSHVFTMPYVKVRLRDGSLHEPGIAGLVTLIGKRLSLDLIFEDLEVARFLAEKSGGSVRDLLRLLGDAYLRAQVDEKPWIDMDSARAAVKKLSINFSRHLLPEVIYYPILAAIHLTKGPANIVEGEATKEKAVAAREFFGELITNGAVLEYNGNDSWYDVHPALSEIEPFKRACDRHHEARGDTPAP